MPERAARRLGELGLARGREDVAEIRRETVYLADVLTHLDVGELVYGVHTAKSATHIRGVHQAEDAAVQVPHVPREGFLGFIAELSLDVFAEGDTDHAARASGRRRVC